MAEQESIQTQLDCLRYDLTGLLELVTRSVAFSNEQRKVLDALRYDVVGLQQRELARDRDILELVHRQKTLGTCMLGLTHHIEVCQKELHLLRDTVASLQQDVATLEKMEGDHINGSTFDGDMKVRLQNLEDKFKLMEESTGIEYNPWYCDDETDEGGAERAEMDYERQVQAEKDYAHHALRED